jgi:uncharacterized protein GlcG (DUF336 family)
MPTTEGAYSYNLPLELAVEAASEAVRVGVINHYQVTATVVNLSGVPQVVLRGDGATIHTGTSSFQKAYTVVTLGPIFNLTHRAPSSSWSRPVPLRPSWQDCRM